MFLLQAYTVQRSGSVQQGSRVQYGVSCSCENIQGLFDSKEYDRIFGGLIPIGNFPIELV